MRLLRSYYPWHVVRGNYEDSTLDLSIKYNGGFVPTYFGSHPDPPIHIWEDLEPDHSYGDSSQYGADGYALAAPSLQGVDLAAALYELGEFPEQLRTTAKGFADLYSLVGGRGGIGRNISNLMGPKSAAEHFLNHAFGWAPFLKDMSDTHKAAKGFKEAFEQHKRDNGRWIKRRRTVLRSKNEVHEAGDGNYAYIRPDIWPIGSWDLNPNTLEPCRAYSDFYHGVELHSWFSGVFKYWVPSLVHDEFDTYSNVINRMRYYGIRVNPKLIYKLTPWSWLADWFGKAGQVRSAILDSPEDNLVSRYAYVMTRLVKKTRHIANIFLTKGGTHTVQWSAFVESKHRSRASPFGFGLSSGDLSAKQLAILASLGITRV